jgi:uncharacterized membrane protein YqhA
VRGRTIEQTVFRLTRLSTLFAIASSFLGALLMFYLGVANTFDAFLLQFGGDVAEAAELPRAELTVIVLMDALDRFLIGMVLLFFSYGVYGLFIRPDASAQEMGLPDWMHVERIGQLKQTIAEVILVVLFVLFLRIALEQFHAGGAAIEPEGAMRFLLLPVSILLLSAALRFVRLDKPAPQTPPEPSVDRRDRTADDA